MKESELRLIFLRISNRYPSFAYDDFKVNDWLELLSSVPAKLAFDNLRKYCLNPENTYPPHPGILAATTTQQANGPAIPNAIETRRMLEERNQLLLMSGGKCIPESVREAMRNLGTKSSDT